MKKIQLPILALCVAAILAGCGKSDNATPTPNGGNTAPPTKRLKLAFVSNNAANSGRSPARAAMPPPRNSATWMWIFHHPGRQLRHATADSRRSRRQGHRRHRRQRQRPGQPDGLPEQNRRRGAFDLLRQRRRFEQTRCLHRHRQRGGRRRSRENDQGMPAQRRQNHVVCRP